MKVCKIIIFVSLLVSIMVYFFYYWFIGDNYNNNYNNNKTTDNNYLIKHTTIVSLFKKISKKYPKYTALIENNKEINYRKYYKQCEKLSKKILFFIGHNPKVCITSSNRIEWYYTNLSTLISNGIFIGISPNIEKDNLEDVINTNKVELLIVENIKDLTKLYETKLPSLKLVILLDNIDDKLEKDLCKNIREQNDNILNILTFYEFINSPINNLITSIEIKPPTSNDKAVIIYHENNKKNITFTHKNIMNTIKSITYAIDTKSPITLFNEKFLSYEPLNKIELQILNIYLPIITSSSVYIPKNNDYLDTIKNIKPTIMIGSNNIYNEIMNNIKDYDILFKNNILKQILSKYIGMSSIKYLINIDNSSNELKNFYSTMNIELCDILSNSEICGFISLGVPGFSKGKGYPLMDIKINSDNEILVKGNNISNDVKLNKKWFNTKITGYIDRCGTLYHTNNK